MLGKLFREDSPARQKVKSFRSRPEAYVANVYDGVPGYRQELLPVP